MKVSTIIISVLLFLGLTIHAFAQSDIKDSTKIYQYWAKRGIIEMVYAYMEDHSSLNGLSPSEKQGIDIFQKNFIENINKELPELDSVGIFLKNKNNGWTKTEENILQLLNQRYIDTVALDSSFFKGIIDKTEYFKWDSKKKEIIEEYQNELADLSNRLKAEEALQQPSIVHVPQEEAQNQLPESDSNWTQSIPYILLFLAGLLLGGWIVFLISKQKIYRILQEEKNHYLYKLKLNEESFLFNFIGLVHILKQRKDEYKKEQGELLEKNQRLDSISRELQTIKRQNEHLAFRKQQTAIDRTTSDSDNAETPSTQEREIKSPEKAKLFFSIPESDGRFKNHNGDPVNDGKKFYCIEFEESSQEGDLLFITSDRDKRAINRLESYLIPVCDIENYTDADSASHIRLVSPGKVTLINDSWFIDPERKVKIKLD